MSKTIERDTTVIYLRVDRKVANRVAAIADERGWPHTIASVAGEALARGLPPRVVAGSQLPLPIATKKKAFLPIAATSKRSRK